MNPGPTLGWIAVAVAYAVVLGSLVLFVGIMSAKRKRLETRRKELGG